MKNKIITGALMLALTISFVPQVSSAKTVPVQMSVSQKSELLARLQYQVKVILELIAMLQAQQGIATSTPAIVATSTPAVVSATSSSPFILTGSIIPPVMQSTNLAIGDITVANGKGNVPLIVSGYSYVGGVARLKGTEVSGFDGGQAWQSPSDAPSFENLDPDTYTYSVKLYDRPYDQTNQGKSTVGVVAEIAGTITIK